MNQVTRYPSFNTDEEDKIDYMSMLLGELQQAISKFEDSEPKDKRKLYYKKWKDEINELFDIYNKKANMKIYIKIK